MCKYLLCSVLFFATTFSLDINTGADHINEQSQQIKVADCPVIALSCPTETVESRDQIFKIAASVSGTAAGAKPLYKWTVDKAEIKSGQGTSEIEIQMTGKKDGFNVTVEIGGLPEGCSNNTASCSLNID